MVFNKKEHDDLLKEIAMTGGATPKMMELLQKLRDDFDERAGMLRKEGEDRDRRDPEGAREEADRIREESRRDDREDRGERRRAYGFGGDRETGDPAPVTREEFDKLRADHERLQREYVERFFSTPEEVIRDQREDVRKDDDVKDLTFEDLFKDREG